VNNLKNIFLGVFLTFASAWIGLVALPYLNLGFLQPSVDEELGEVLPPPRPGLAAVGSKVYAGEGCMYCHSQQIRPEWAGSDIARGWGLRRTVPRDYIYESPVYLGTMRTGPDLSNIGARQPSKEWHYKHLYAPRVMGSQHSIMPSYKHLFKVQKVDGAPAADALEFAEGDGVEIPEGHEIVPTQRARALVEYLVSLNRNYSLPEAPVE